MEILACLHIRKPAKAVLAFLGTGWQRFRFRLGRPRAAAHVWGKGARILTEINRLPQLHLPAPAQSRWKISSVSAAANASSPASSHPIPVPYSLIRRSEGPFRRKIWPIRRVGKGLINCYRSCAFWPCSRRSARSSSSFFWVKIASPAKSPFRSASAICVRKSLSRPSIARS